MGIFGGKGNSKNDDDDDDDDDVSEEGYDPGDEGSQKEAEDFIGEEWLKDS